MNIQVYTDNHTPGSVELKRHVEEVVERALERYGDRITRVEVHLADQDSSQKYGERDKRCLMEARLAGLQPIAVSHEGATLDQAIDGAADTLQKTIQRTLERRTDAKRTPAPEIEPLL